MVAELESEELALSVRELHDLAVQVAHDVRSPLMAMSSYAECLGYFTDLDEASRQRYARAITVETRRVDRMLADFMVLVGHRRADLVETFDFAQVLSATIERLADLFTMRGIELQVRVQGPTPLLTWPAAVLRQIIAGALESVLSAVSEGNVLTAVVMADGPDQIQLLITTSSETPVMHLSRLLNYRSAARLLAERGGEMRRLHGEQSGLALFIPIEGEQVVGDTWTQAQEAI